MSVENGERLVTKQDLADFYNGIRPYMGGIVTSKAGFTPIGTIISVMGTTAPANYLACDGTVYNIADYVELANYFNEQFGSKNFFGGDGTTTFAVPDLRGEFLRGTGTNSHENQGSGANVGVHQDATEHLDIINYSNENNLQVWGANGTKANKKDSSLNNSSDYVNNGGGVKGVYDGYSSHYTSRPTNTSVLYCIATKNFYIDPTLDYSTDEKIVGTWITGEPIYQKTIVTTLPAKDVITTVPIGASIENIVDIRTMVVTGTNRSLFQSANALSSQDADTTSFVKIYGHNYLGNNDGNNPNELVLINHIKVSTWDNSPVYVTIQYTKHIST